ncbi:MAG TPA: CBS domain-containing protein [Hyphomicrobiaceae bacterium]|nr:CBS domain-containing protein [Hyphomicrobiaceae bacterium]
MKVADILATKGSTVVTIKPTDTIGALCERLREKRIGAAVVSSDGQAVEGMISERDVAYGLAVHKGALPTLQVSALMTKRVITCSSSDSVSSVAGTMMAHTIRHIPVQDDGRLVGMVSIRDVLNVRVDDLQRQTSQLRAFAYHVERNPPEDR